MDTPAPVLLHSPILGLKGTAADLIRIHETGFYEVNLKFGDNVHRVFLPIGDTVVVAREPEIKVAFEGEVER